MITSRLAVTNKCFSHFAQMKNIILRENAQTNIRCNWCTTSVHLLNHVCGSLKLCTWLEICVFTTTKNNEPDNCAQTH